MARPKSNPALRRETINARLPAWLRDWLESQPESGGVLIERALIKAHKLKAPK